MTQSDDAKSGRSGILARVREAMRAVGRDREFTAADIINRLHVQTYREARRVRGALQWFKRTGEAMAVSRGVYLYTGRGDEGRSSGVRARVLRAVHVKGVFTVSDLSMLADAEKSYATRIVRELARAGDIERAGKVPGKLQRVAAYRVRNPNEFYLKYVRGR